MYLNESLSNPADVGGGRSIPCGGNGECGNVKLGSGELALIEEGVLGCRALWVLLMTAAAVPMAKALGRRDRGMEATASPTSRRRIRIKFLSQPI